MQDDNDDDEAMPPPPDMEVDDTRAYHRPESAADEDEVKPPQETPPDYIPTPNRNIKGSSFEDELHRNRVRSASRSNAGGVVLAPGHSNLTTMPPLRVTKASMAVHNALRYRLQMRPYPAPLFVPEREALDDAVATYLKALGFTRTLTALRSSPESRVPPEPGFGTSLTKHLVLATTRTNDLFDDETTWNSEAFFRNSWPFVTLEDRQKNSLKFATVDRLLEKLILEEGDAPLVPRAVEINFTTVFLTLGPLFVCVPVLLSKLFKIFKTLSLQSKVISEGKSLVWQRRIVQILTAYVSQNRIDVTRVEAERALSFLLSVVHTTGQHPSLIHAASAALDKLKQIGFDDGVAPSRWCMQPCFLDHKPTKPSPAAGPPGHPLPTHFEKISELDFAQQLTLMEFEMFSRISSREFANGAWFDPLMKHAAAPHLLDFLNHRERLVIWIASLIITPIELPVRRAVYARVVRIAKLLFESKNYFASQALLSALELSCVGRLHNTILSSALTADEIDSLTALKNTFDPYNGTIKNIPYNLSTPCIPVLNAKIQELARANESMTLISQRNITDQDLVALGMLPSLQDASPAVVQRLNPVSLVNWSFVVTIAKTVMRIISYQSLPYTEFVPRPNIQRFIASTPGWRTEDALYELAAERLASHGA